MKDGFRKTNFCYTKNNQKVQMNSKLKYNGYYEFFNHHTGVVYSKGKGLKTKIDTLETISKLGLLFYKNGIAFDIYFKDDNLVLGQCYRCIIYEDTIKMLTLYTGQSQYTVFKYYEILSDSTLKYLGFSNDEEPDRERINSFVNQNEENINPFGKYSLAHFCPLDSIPYENEDCWMENKKWFWCDKEEYKSWKKSKK